MYSYNFYIIYYDYIHLRKLFKVGYVSFIIKYQQDFVLIQNLLYLYSILKGVLNTIFMLLYQNLVVK